MSYIYTRKHHKEDSSCWGSSFRKISVKGSIPKYSSVRGSSPRWKVTFAIDVKGGEIYQINNTFILWLKGSKISITDSPPLSVIQQLVSEKVPSEIILTTKR
jgi:hypothetical protein